MKIGINASFLRKPDTGIGQVTRGFLEELLKHNSDKNEYFLYLEEDIPEKSDSFGDLGVGSLKNFRKRVFLPKSWKRDDLARKIWWEMFLLPRAAKRDNCDVFISPYQAPTTIKGIRHIMIVHDMIIEVFPEYKNDWRKKLYAFLWQRAAKRADKIFTVSEWSKRDIHKYLRIPLKKIVVAYPSVDSAFFSEIDWQKDNAVLEKYGIYGRYIFYIGGFDLRKNVAALLKAYAIFIEKTGSSEMKLVLGGEDRSSLNPLYTDVKKEIEKLDLGKHVHLTGFVEQKDLPAIYRHAELFVLPTLYEGFGLMALEAMASGTPVIASKSSSLPEVGGDAVLYCNPYDVHEMARVMGKIMKNENLKRSLSSKGKRRAKNFTWKKFAEAILTA